MQFHASSCIHSLTVLLHAYTFLHGPVHAYVFLAVAFVFHCVCIPVDPILPLHSHAILNIPLQSCMLPPTPLHVFVLLCDPLHSYVHLCIPMHSFTFIILPYACLCILMCVYTGMYLCSFLSCAVLSIQLQLCQLCRSSDDSAWQQQQHFQHLAVKNGRAQW